MNLPILKEFNIIFAHKSQIEKLCGELLKQDVEIVTSPVSSAKATVMLSPSAAQYMDAADIAKTIFAINEFGEMTFAKPRPFYKIETSCN